VLAAIFLIGGALWAFAKLAGEVLEGDTRAFDRAVLLALRDPMNPDMPIGPVGFRRPPANSPHSGAQRRLCSLRLRPRAFFF